MRSDEVYGVGNKIRRNNTRTNQCIKRFRGRKENNKRKEEMERKYEELEEKKRVARKKAKKKRIEKIRVEKEEKWRINGDNRRSKVSSLEK